MPMPKQPKRKVRIDSEKYLIRTIEPDDASDRWASWMSDPEVTHMLNLRARTWKKADFLDYMKTFDQQSSLLLGIFEKQRGTHIGMFTVDINHVRSQFLVNLLIVSRNIETSMSLRALRCRFESISSRRLD